MGTQQLKKNEQEPIIVGFSKGLIIVKINGKGIRIVFHFIEVIFGYVTGTTKKGESGWMVGS